MSEYFLIEHCDGPNGKVTCKRASKDRNGHWQEFGRVEIWDLPVPEIRLAVEILALVEKYR